MEEVEIKSAKMVEGDETLGKVALEKKMLAEHEQQANADAEKAKADAELARQAEEAEKAKVAETELDDTVVLSHINKKYQKGYASFDELLTPQTIEKQVELPEDVSAFYKFKQETGRGLSDYMKIQRDFAKENPETILAEYMAIHNPELDESDIAYEIQKEFGIDEALDTENEIKAKTIAKKKELSKAIAYFEQQKEQYKMPTESAVSKVPDEEKEAYEAYKKEVLSKKSDLEKGKVLNDYFVQKTNELFTNDFKGFEFKVGDKSFTYTPAEVEKIKQAQLNVGNFVGSHLNEEGYLKDANAYHKSLAVAMNPDLFASHFYEQGKADAIAEQAIASKNINMGKVRAVPEVVQSVTGMKARMLDDTNGTSLKIPSTTKK